MISTIAGTVKCLFVFFQKRRSILIHLVTYSFSALVFQLIPYLAHVLLLIVSTDGSK